MSDTFDVFHAGEAAALIASGATLERHAHQMRLSLPVPAHDNAEFLAFAADATPPVPWTQILPSLLAAYPPEHPDYLSGDEALIDSYLLPYTVGAKLGPLICEASAIAVRDGHAYGGILVVDRPGEGPWVCDIWRDPDPRYAGTGTALLRWAAARLAGYASLGLVVTTSNERAERAYLRAGFIRETTSWKFRRTT
ncbi:MAG: GNAT family N-acetyltransferase [Candidatus Nanopelagicales bacterium]